MSAEELRSLSERELIILIMERMDNLLSKVESHEADISSLKASRSEATGFWKGANWLMGIPGVAALFLAGKDKL